MSRICDTCRNEHCRTVVGNITSCDFYVGGETRYERLFGTPERAARTLEEFELDQLNWCHGTDACEKCPYEFDRYGCCLPDGFSLLEWLKGVTMASSVEEVAIFKKYKVIVTMTAYPSGSLLAIHERCFDTESEAMEFCKENNWENPTETSTATVYEYKVKAGWFPTS